MIREMEERDLDRVAQIEQVSIAQPWSRQSFADSMKQSYTLFLIEETDADIKGYVGMYLTGDSAEITGIAVDPSWRRKHTATALLSEAKQKALAQGMTEIVLEVRESNAGARAFYEKHGFEILGIRKRFYSCPVEDAVIMRLELKEGNE